MSSDSASRRLSQITSAFSLPSFLPSSSLSSSSTAHFAQVSVAPPDEVFNVSAKFKADNDSKKVDLGVGAYRTDEGKPLVLNVVKKAEARVLADLSLNKEYLTIDGDAKFVKFARELFLGENSPAIKENRIASAQCLSGTGSLRMGFEFIAKYLPKGTTVYVSKPTWGNHMSIVQHSLQGLQWKYYRYWDPKGRKLDISGLLEDIKNAPNNSVILLHACAHNPTGVDPTQAEWKQIASVIREKNHLPFFDSAYQGFATGSLEGDSWAVRYFVSEGFELLGAQSFAKNFGLYNERIGLLSIVTSTPAQASAVLSQLKIIIRANYSNPPSHGARVVAAVLSDPQLFSEWKEELKGMSGRIQSMRKALRGELERLGTPGDWSHITSQIGMFSFTGLSPKQCELLSNKYHIYLLSSGRISVAGLNTKNVKYVAQAIDDAVKNVK